MRAEPSLRPPRPDLLLFSAVILLVVIGVVSIYSASYPRAAVTSKKRAAELEKVQRTVEGQAAEGWKLAAEPGNGPGSSLERIEEMVQDQQQVMRKQLTWAWLGLFTLIAAMVLPYEWLRSRLCARLLIGVSVALLLAVLHPAFGKDLGRVSQRWLVLGPFSMQPTEFVKVALCVWLAYRLAELRGAIRMPEHFAVIMVQAGGIFILVLAEPHLGATMVMASATVAMLYIAGSRLSHLGVVGALGLCGVVGSIALRPYQMLRIKSWLNPERFAEDIGYQAVHCNTALARGGLIGRGLGRSIEKFFYLPECYTDSIVAIIGEEAGFLGLCVIIALFLVIAWRGLRIARRCPDRFGSLLATGLTAVLFLQAMFNLGVTSGLLPQTGTGLPFISYGGSSLCCFMAAAGLLLNISRECPPVRTAAGPPDERTHGYSSATPYA